MNDWFGVRVLGLLFRRDWRKLHLPERRKLGEL